MKKLLIIIASILVFTGCTSYTCPTYAQKNSEFSYFIIAMHGTKSMAIDYNCKIWISKDYLVIKSESFGVPDTRFNFKNTEKVKGKKAWQANPLGEPYVKVYIEYSKGEYIMIYFPKNNVVTYFISTDIKKEFKPLNEYGKWYEKIN